MNETLILIGERIRGLRITLDISIAEMAKITGVSEAEYLALETGKEDFTFTFLYKCATRFGVDITEILTGDKPKLSLYSVVRKNEGLPIDRRQGFQYQNLAYLFRDKISEPFLVTAPYRESEQDAPIHLSTHEGQEFDFVISGSLKAQIEDHVEILRAGDAIYYDSAHRHGMIATAGEDCVFLAVVMRKE